MRLPTLGAKYQTTLVQVKNADTVAIPNGSPICFAYNGTDDGLAVVLPSTGGVTKASNLFAGVCNFSGSTSLPVGSIGDAQFFGMVTNARLLLVTRSATSAVWPSYAAIAVGDALAVETVNNVFTDLAAGAQTAFGVQAVAAAAIASATTQASTTSSGSLLALNAATALTVATKVNLRAM